ncbi:MAG: Ppx/GppA phosphatase family protein [Myxococcota bacterium]|jgi:exopolyphosphatase/guanosine-5'-triphosphate,3'-diphosphate pyrophosphatase
MPNVAAIDAGSNALRLTVASVNRAGAVKVIDYLREPIRLGGDVFSTGVISPETTARAEEAFKNFRAVIAMHRAVRVRAVGTSALREAHNRVEFIAKVALASGIDIDPIGGEEEARLLCRAVVSALDMKGRSAIHIDIGGGSAELTLIEGGQVSTSSSFKMGGVRLLQLFGQRGASAAEFVRTIRDYLGPTSRFIQSSIGGSAAGLCVGTGGNIETLGELRRTLLHKRSTGFMTMQELGRIVSIVRPMSVEDRVLKLGLRPDRADVVLPASIVLEYLLEQSGLGRLEIPHVGLKDGILSELAGELGGGDDAGRGSQVLQSARVIGRKFSFDERHASAVAGYAGQIFDSTRSLHLLGREDRLLLIAAAWLHDVGQFLGLGDHHKHSLYIINAIPIVGLDDGRRRVVANVARYHHKSVPRLKHEQFAALPQDDRMRVRKLSAMLRMADAMDFEHAGKPAAVTLSVKGGALRVAFPAGSRAELARWAVAKRAVIFEEVFGVKVQVS